MRQTALRPGSSGPFVREMQLALNNRLNPSPNLKISGIYDISTGRAVRAFQIANWLEADGCAGPCTLDVLYSLEKSGPILHSVSPISQTANTPAWAAALAMLTHRSVGTILAAVPLDLLNPNKTLVSDPDHIRLQRQRLDLVRCLGLNYHSPRNWYAPDLVGLLRKGPLVIEFPQPRSHSALAPAAQSFVVIAGARGSHSADGSSTTLKIFDPSTGADPIRSQSFVSLKQQFSRTPFGVITL